MKKNFGGEILDGGVRTKQRQPRLPTERGVGVQFRESKPQPRTQSGQQHRISLLTSLNTDHFVILKSHAADLPAVDVCNVLICKRLRLTG